MDDPAKELATWQCELFEENGAGPKVGAKVPRLLEVAYESPGVRNLLVDNGLLHLYSPAELKSDGDVLIFACESQGLVEWGVRKGDSDEENPRLVSNLTGKWVDEGCDLLSYLKLYIALNRLSEEPCTEALSSKASEKLEDAARLRSEWEPLTVEFQSLDWSCTVWKKGGAVAAVDAYGAEGGPGSAVVLGARDPAELATAMEGLVGV